VPWICVCQLPAVPTICCREFNPGDTATTLGTSSRMACASAGVSDVRASAAARARGLVGWQPSCRRQPPQPPRPARRSCQTWGAPRCSGPARRALAARPALAPPKVPRPWPPSHRDPQPDRHGPDLHRLVPLGESSAREPTAARIPTGLVSTHSGAPC
jgi:hypothetical protein